MSDCHNLHIGIPITDRLKGIYISLCALIIKEWWFINKEHSKLYSCRCCLDLGQCKDNGKRSFYLLASALGSIWKSCLAIFVDQNIQRCLVSVLSFDGALHHKFHSHRSTSHLAENIVRSICDMRNDVPDDLVRNSVL